MRKWLWCFLTTFPWARWLGRDDPKVLSDPCVVNLRGNPFRVNQTFIRCNRFLSKFHKSVATASLGSDLHLLRAPLATTNRAEFAQMRPENTAQCHDEQQTEYCNYRDHRIAQDVFFVRYWLLAEDRCRNTSSLATVFLDATWRAAVFISGTCAVA